MSHEICNLAGITVRKKMAPAKIELPSGIVLDMGWLRHTRIYQHSQFVAAWSIIPMTFFSMLLGFIVVVHLSQWQNKVSSSLSKTMNFLCFIISMYIFLDTVCFIVCRSPLWITTVWLMVFITWVVTALKMCVDCCVVCLSGTIDVIVFSLYWKVSFIPLENKESHNKWIYIYVIYIYMT